MNKTGIAGLVRLGVALDSKLGLSIESIGRSAQQTVQDCVMEVCGRHLAYFITLRGGWAWLYASPMDSGDEPQLLINFADNWEGFQTIYQIISAFEKHEIRSLKRPIEAGIGPGGFVVGD